MHIQISLAINVLPYPGLNTLVKPVVLQIKSLPMLWGNLFSEEIGL